MNESELDSGVLVQEQDDAEPSHEAGLSRRTVCFGLGGVAAMLAIGAVKFAPEAAVVRPPGGQDEAALIAACIRCERCVEACPRHVMKLSHLENGVLVARTPEMNFAADYCDFCESENDGRPRCVAACPTSALKFEEGATPSQDPIGGANLIEDWCLAYNDTGCRTCYEACPYGAMALDELGRPYVLEDKCNGCGACEAACVSLTNASRSLTSGATSKAIVVKPMEG